MQVNERVRMVEDSLGLKPGQEFILVINGIRPSYNPVSFKNGWIIDSSGEKLSGQNALLGELIRGFATVEAMPWEPEKGENYYVVDRRNKNGLKGFTYTGSKRDIYIAANYARYKNAAEVVAFLEDNDKEWAEANR